MPLTNRDWVWLFLGLIGFAAGAIMNWWNVVRGLRTGRIRARYGSWFSRADQPVWFWCLLWFSLFWAIVFTLLALLILVMGILNLLGVE